MKQIEMINKIQGSTVCYTLKDLTAMSKSKLKKLYKWILKAVGK